jgi:two-component sensor histidine kinase
MPELVRSRGADCAERASQVGGQRRRLRGARMSAQAAPFLLDEGVGDTLVQWIAWPRKTLMRPQAAGAPRPRPRQETVMTAFVHAQAACPRPVALHLVEEIGHRVVNEYTEAITLLGATASLAPDKRTRECLTVAAERLTAYVAAHRALLPPAGEGAMDLGDYIGRLCSAYSRASLAERRIWISVDTEEIRLASERCWRVGLIVTELVRNAARHGLAGRCGAIAVSLAWRSGRVTCLVRDNGFAAANAYPGRGLRLAQSLAAELGGSVSWEFSAQGTQARLDLPADDIA